MPPKKQPNAPSKKTVQKQKEKLIEDKTFGMKNKKGAQNQKLVNNIRKQIEHGDKRAKDADQAKQDREARAKAAQKAKEDLDKLFKPVIEVQKVQPGVDPKSVLCAYHKQGLCKKGDKCKFSHDLNIERKAAKRSIYVDEKQDITADEMSQWDQAKLEEVVDSKHGKANKGLPPTTIICKYFLDAVECNKYGYFWECPNGPKCHYRHALPPGFVLKKDKKRMDEQKDPVICLEELIETERQNLGMQQTKVTYKTFMEWKTRKRKEKKDRLQEEKVKKQKSFKTGHIKGLSGRELFEFNPDLVGEEPELDGDVIDSALRECEESEYVGPIRDICHDDFVELDDGADEAETTQAGAASAGLIDEDLFAEDLIEDDFEHLQLLDEA